VDGDRGVDTLAVNQCFIIVYELDDKQLLAHQLVPIGEQLVAVETMPVLASFGDLNRRETLDEGRCLGGGCYLHPDHGGRGLGTLLLRRSGAHAARAARWRLWYDITRRQPLLISARR
jgi:GNAT superfamily N-acetyltransferase